MSRRMDREFGIDATERLVLAEVDANPGLTGSDLANGIGIPSSVVMGLDAAAQILVLLADALHSAAREPR